MRFRPLAALVCLVLPTLPEPAQALTRFVPASAHAAGAGGAFFATDLRIWNPSEAGAIRVTVELLGAAGEPPEPAELSVPARGTLAVDDVLLTLFGRDSAVGGLRVSSSSDFRATSTTYNLVPDGAGCWPGGTFGQLVPALLPAEALSHGVLLHLSNAPRSRGFRTNVGVFNPRAGANKVRVTLRDAEGEGLGVTVFDTLPAYGFRQWNDVFAAAGAPGDVDDARAEVLADAPAFVYASVVDNLTQDPVFVPLQSTAAAATELLVPAAAHADGAQGSHFETELRLFNPTTSGAAALLELLPAGADGTVPRSVEVSVPARGTLRLPDVLAETFGLSSAVGAIRITASRPLLGSSNTFHRNGESAECAPGGTLGQLVPVLPADSGRASGVILHLSNDAAGSGRRSNVGVVNPGARSLSVTARLRRGDGTLAGSATAVLPPRSFHQWNTIFSAAGAGGEVVAAASAELASLDGSPFFAFGSVVDNVTNDPFFVPLAEDPGAVSPCPSGRRTRGPAAPGAFADDGVSLFVGDASGGIWKMSRSGSPAVRIASLGSSTVVAALAVDAALLFAAAYDVGPSGVVPGSGRVVSMGKDGGSLRIVASSLAEPSTIGIDSAELFVGFPGARNAAGCRNADGSVLRMTRSGGSRRTLASGLAGVAKLVVGPADVFVGLVGSCSVFSSPIGVRRLPKGSGLAETLDESRPAADLALDGEELLVAGGSAGTVHRVSTSGGVTAVLASGPAYVGSVAATRDEVLFVAGPCSGGEIPVEALSRANGQRRTLGFLPCARVFGTDGCSAFSAGSNGLTEFPLD